MFVLIGCGGDGDPPGNGSNDDQTPPTGGAVVEAWLAEGAYKSWSCEDAVHEARSPSPHGFNRICSNDAIANNTTASTPWPVGAAAVKELYASIGGAQIGVAVYRKLDADSADGANWYWYERISEDVIADGNGDAGPAKSICVGCHVGAGVDAEHTPTAGARDQVYTPVAN